MPGLALFLLTHVFRQPVRSLPFHLELAQYFHTLVTIFTRADGEPGDFDTVFGFSGLPYYLIHLALQRAHDDEIAPVCGATVLPPALRPNVHDDLVSLYQLLAQDERFARYAFPDLDFGQELPPDMFKLVHGHLRAEHKAFIDHL